MDEETIYTDNTVAVTTARVIISGTTYALRNITSVQMTITPPKQGGTVTLIIVGVLALVCSIGMFANDRNAAIGFLSIAIFLIGLGIVAIIRSNDAYNVTIASSAGEIRALTSQSKEYISTIVGAINEAIVRCR